MVATKIIVATPILGHDPGSNTAPTGGMAMATKKDSIKATPDAIRRATCPAGERYVYIKIEGTPGLQLYVAANGTKNFIFYGKFPNGSPRRFTFASAHDLDITDAIKRVHAIRAEIKAGIDPSKSPTPAHDSDALHTVADLIRFRKDDKELKEGSKELITFRSRSAPFERERGTAKLASLTLPQLKAFFETHETYKHAPTTTDRLITDLRAAWNSAVKQGRISAELKNPFTSLARSIKQIRAHKPESMAVDLDADEWNKLLSALNSNRPPHGVLKIMMMTGARPSEVLSLRFDELTEEDGLFIATKKTHKNARKGKTRTIYLTGPAVDVIKEMQNNRIEGNPFVFPGTVTGQHYAKDGVQRAFNAIRAKLKLEMKLYSIRSAYINRALRNSTEPFKTIQVVARNVGNSPSIIMEHYAAMSERDAKQLAIELGQKLAGQ